MADLPEPCHHTRVLGSRCRKCGYEPDEEEKAEAARRKRKAKPDPNDPDGWRDETGDDGKSPVLSTDPDAWREYIE